MKLRSCLWAAALLCSCTSDIPKEKLTIIDGYRLGQSQTTLTKQLDSLSIPYQRFTTKQVMTTFNQLMDDGNYISMRYTNTFNLPTFKGKYNEHVGLFYPVIYQGTKNIFGMIILLAHTSKPWLMGDAKQFESTLEVPLIKQDVNKDLLEEIKGMLTAKYGQPAYVSKSSINPLYVIERDGVKYYMGDPDREGEEITWHTQYYTVKLFTGLPSYESVWEEGERTYREHVHLAGTQQALLADTSKGEVPCYSYPYLRYELTSEAIKALKLDQQSL